MSGAASNPVKKPAISTDTYIFVGQPASPKGQHSPMDEISALSRMSSSSTNLLVRRPSISQNHAVSPEPTGKTLSKVKKFFLQFRRLRESRLVSEEDREAYKKAREKLINHHFTRSEEFLSASQAKLTPDEHDPMLLTVSEDFFLEDEDSEIIDSHEDVAKAAVKPKAADEQPIHKDVAPIMTDIGTMKAYFVNERGVLQEGGVNPTSFSLGQPGDSDHLFNIFVIPVVGPDGRQQRAIIRTGVIDSKQRKDEFLAVLMKVHQDLPPGSKKMRIVSHQLNSFNERGMIEKQHEWISGINEHLKEKNIGEIVHINTPSNRWVNFEKTLHLQRFLGEGLSKTQNLDSWGTYCRWMVSDLEQQKGNMSPYVGHSFTTIHSSLSHLDLDCSKHVVDVVEKRKKYDECMEAFLTFRDGKSRKDKYIALMKARSQLKMSENRLNEARKQNKIALVNIYHQLEKLEQDLIRQKKTGAVPEITHAMLRKVSLMRMVLGSQLDIPGAELDRGQEGMAIQMLNQELGVTSAMNCKSGLDRTGLWHAVTLSLETMRKKDPKFGPEREFQLINTWESTTEKMNLMIQKCGYAGFKRCLDHGAENPMWQAFFPGISDKEITSLIETMKDVMKFRMEVLKHLIKEGIPITRFSTGLVGLKWNKGWQENLIPQNFLPPYIMVKKKGNPPTVVKVKLLDYDDEGHPKGLTKQGRRLLIKFSESRAS